MVLVYLSFDYSNQYSKEDIKNKYSNSLDRYQNVNGLIKKYYTINSKEKLAGGVYLFKDIESAKNLLESKIFRNRIKKVFGTKKEMKFEYESVQYIVDNTNEKISEI